MATTLRQAVLLAMKDTRVFFKDRFAVAFSFLFPFLFIIGFSLALSGQGPSDEASELTIATQERDEISRFIIDSLSPNVDPNFTEMGYEEALAATENGTIPGFIAFPSDFSQMLMNGEPTSLQVVLGDGSSGQEAVLIGFASSLTRSYVEAQVVTGTVFGLIDSGAVDIQISEVGYTVLGRDELGGIGLEVQTVGDVEPYNASNFTLPGYLVMFVFFAAAMSAEAIARERRNHTLERLMSNGVRRESIVLGKFLSAAVIGLMQVAILWIVGVQAFGIDLGVSPSAVVLISILMVLASASFGVLLASFISEVRAVSTAAVLASLVLAPLGGCWWPLFITPEWMQSLAKITPHGWANTGFNKLMLFGAEFGDVTQEMVALVAFGLAFLAVAMWRFRLSAE